MKDVAEFLAVALIAFSVSFFIMNALLWIVDRRK